MNAAMKKKIGWKVVRKNADEEDTGNADEDKTGEDEKRNEEKRDGERKEEKTALPVVEHVSKDDVYMFTGITDKFGKQVRSILYFSSS